LERFKFKSLKAEQLAIQSLVFLGYPEDISLNYFINDDGIITYFAEYERFERGKNEKFILPLKKSEYVNLIISALEQKGYIVDKLNVCFQNNELCYEAFVDIVVYGTDSKRVRRRK